MIDRVALLSDLQSLLKRLEADLLERSESAEVPEVREWLRAEYQKAKDSERTAATFKQWVDDFVTQVAAAWVLSCVFARFLEDNGLVDPPRISGPGPRLERARDEHTLFFQAAQRATLTDREYLLDVFAGLAALPDGGDVFGAHNPVNTLPNWLGPDAAGELLRFFQKIDSDSGQLVHDFCDPTWDTRFLGDLYQDLSEAARKKYALLQTPEFVEEFILDRTLDPALDEFGLTPPLPRGGDGRGEGADSQPSTRNSQLFKLIDPACGSGHFLLGAFPRILDRWQKQEPGTNVRELVQRALHSIHGVDVNPYAIAIARFRLLLAALRACGITQLKDAPAFELHLVCGDSLYHGRQRQKTRGDWSDEAHYFESEDSAQLRAILREGTYHCVVANPPYITPKDRAANEAYRKLYPQTCHMKYSLAVPFLERILKLAVLAPSPPAGGEGRGEGAGYTGQITANSFMKREFGKKLIESFFPSVDLTHVIDTSGAYIPGHGTPTVILFARHRAPVSDTLRTVMGIRGEPSTPDDPSRGLVWTAIVEQIDQPGSQSDFVSVGDSPRDLFHKHPWSIGGGGAAELKEQLEHIATAPLGSVASNMGFFGITGEEQVYSAPTPSAFNRKGIGQEAIRQFVIGEDVRDWVVGYASCCIFPYDDEISFRMISSADKHFWTFRRLLESTLYFGKTKSERGMDYREFVILMTDRLKSPYSISYSDIATHNNFVLDRGGRMFNSTAPVIKLPAEVATADGGTRPVTEDDHLALLGLLNSSTACFWMKQVCFPKGGDHVGQEGARVRRSLWDERYAFNATNLERFPLPEGRPLELARQLDGLALELQTHAPQAVVPQAGHSPRRHGEHGENQLLENGSVNSVSPWCPPRAESPSCPPTTESPSCLPLRESLATAHTSHDRIRGEMIRLQEDLDWQCYQLYGLLDEELISPRRHGEHGDDQTDSSVNSVSPWCNFFPINLGERAFEIVLARKLAAGELQTTWFERHGSTPITELPADWPDDYRQLVERRIAVIESNPQIALIEQPEYKRRWNTEPWDSQVERALRAWLLDRLESYFDFDGRMSEKDSPRRHGEHGDGGFRETEKEISVNSVSPWCNSSAPPPLADIQLVSVGQLADVAAKDAGFMEVAEVYRDDPAFNVLRLVEELVQAEHVPLLPVLRYKPSGLRKREQWEETWDLQRQEDSWTTILCHEIREDHQVASESDTLRYSDIDWRSVASLMAIQQPDEADDEKEALTDEFASQLERQFESEDDIPVSSVARFVNQHLLGDVPVPPKYTSADFISTGGARYWSLRGKLDVPKERWISFPHCEGPDGTLMIAWAGYNHLQQATAIAAYFVRVKEELGGADDPRLLPLLSALVELLPWLKQWHNDIDPEFGVPMGDYYEGFVQEEARALQKTIDDLKAWQPPARKKAARKKATRKKVAE